MHFCNSFFNSICPQISLNGESSTDDSEDEGKLVICDTCVICLGVLTTQTELLKCVPCGCSRADIACGAEWVAARGTCYQCREKVESSGAIDNVIIRSFINLYYLMLILQAF